MGKQPYIFVSALDGNSDLPLCDICSIIIIRYCFP